MHTFRCALTTLILLSLLRSLPGQESSATAEKQTAMTSTVTGESTHNYLLYLPKDYDKSKEYPLVLFLHGAGERGENDMDLLKVHGPPKLIEAGKEFPFIIVSPQCKPNSWWEAAELSDLLDHVESKYSVDEDRIYVTGLSMGGYGTWALASYEPERFAAIAPVCGGGNALAARFRTPIKCPIWAFHGDADTVVPLARSEEMIAALKDKNQNMKLTVYPGVGHNSWTATYDNEELYKWLLKHSLAP